MAWIPPKITGLPLGSREGAEFVSARCIACVNTDVDDIAGSKGRRPMGSRVSSVMGGDPYEAGVAARSRNNHRGVIMENDR